MAWRGIDGPPVSYLVSGEWPHGEVVGPVPAEVARQLGVALDGAMGGRGVREVARLAGMNHAALGKLLRGQVWPDLVTVSRLEAALDVDLWPGRVGGG